MSTDDKSEDKKEIEEEEREKMLNEENKPETEKMLTPEIKPESEVEKVKKALEESEKEKEKEGKKKIPIGGIKIPGFLRSRSREKTKEGESDLEEGKDLLPEAPATLQVGEAEEEPRRLPAIKIPNPFAKKKDDNGEPGASTSAGSTKGKKPRLLEAIQQPLMSIFPRKNKAPKEGELGQAGLASMETLDDSGAATNEDGMESVKLDMEDKLDSEKKDDDGEKNLWRERLRALSSFKLIIGAVILFILLLIIIIVVAVSGPRPSPPPSEMSGRYVQANTGCGPVTGVLEDGAYVFRGIPYAVPPIGDLRWTRAKALNELKYCWNGILNTFNNSPPLCLQRSSNGTLIGNEDCLTLDIITPRVDYELNTSVIVLLGAASLTDNSPGLLTPSPYMSRSKDVVFVRPNFRLGLLGFLSAVPLANATYPHSSGNYGLTDIIEALKWVRLNIKHFGGNAEKVTILGYRAGATLATALATSRETKDLFSQAWLSSGSAKFPGRSLHESNMLSNDYLGIITECNGNISIECLRSLDAEQLYDYLPDSWINKDPVMPAIGEIIPHEWLVLDGRTLTDNPHDVLKTDDVHIKMVFGTTTHIDASDTLQKIYEEWESNNTFEENLSKTALGNTSGLVEDAVKQYGKTWAGFSSMVSDIRTLCPLLQLSRSMSKAVPFYVVQPPKEGELAEQGMDVLAILGQYYPPATEHKRYISAIQQLFYYFVSHGNIKYETTPRNTVLLIAQDANPSREYPKCDLWFKNDIVPRYGRLD